MLVFDWLDVPFERAPVQCYGSSGTPYTRWIPTGMPQLGQYSWMLDNVFFLYHSVADALAGTAAGGTGFFVSVPSTRWGKRAHHIHAVTNWHNVCSEGCPVIRLNRRDGTAETLDYGPEDWFFEPGGPDIAISPSLYLDAKVFAACGVGIGSILSAEMEKTSEIGEADDVFMVGRFIDYDGGAVNRPAFRFGHISIAAAHVRQPTMHEGRSVVLDMHSRTGYSGSPVWVYRTPGSFFPNKNRIPTGHMVRLLGIHWGQFPERWEIENDGSVKQQSAGTAVIKDKRFINGLSGMTCAIPGAEILRLLNMDPLMKMREQAEKDTIAAGLAPSDSEPIAESESPTTPDNPRHKEDFTALLGAAAKGKSEGSGT